jgi:cation diffusion facilitator family transporter
LQRDRDNRLTVARSSIAISAGLTLFKLAVGFSTNSLGILSDAMHSGLDIIAAFMTLYAIRMVMRPPDFRYNYGYAKVESMSSLAEIILLFIVAGWIFYEGVNRIFFKSIEPEVTILSFAIMLGSMGVDFERSRVLYRTARKFGSQALEADALHFRTDMISSAIIIVGLALVFLYHVPNADAYAAIVVAAMIIYTSLGLGRRTLDVLLDRAPKGAYQRVVETVSGLEGVNRAHDIRVRKMGSETLVDMHIEVPRTLTHDKAHRVATAVEDKVRNALPNSDVLVHVDAIETAGETITDRIRLIAAETEGIKNVHSIYLSAIPSTTHASSTETTRQSEKKQDIYNSNENMLDAKTEPKLHLYLDVQLDSSLDLMTAHNIVDLFENEVKQNIPQISNITAHIETETSKNVEIGTQKRINQSYVENIRKIALSADRVADCKDISVVDINGELHITLVIKIKPTHEKSFTSIEEAHRLATNVQNLIVKDTGASRVVVHAEPG